MAKTRLGACRARFWRGLRTSRACFGRSWAAAGPSWVPLGRPLGTSWALLAVSWLAWGTSGLHFGSQDWPRLRFWRAGGRPRLRFGRFSKRFRHAFCYTSLLGVSWLHLVRHGRFQASLWCMRALLGFDFGVFCYLGKFTLQDSAIHCPCSSCTRALNCSSHCPAQSQPLIAQCAAGNLIPSRDPSQLRVASRGSSGSNGRSRICAAPFAHRCLLRHIMRLKNAGATPLFTLALRFSPAARRYVRSTSAASRRDAERARFKVQVA